ncbi:MAG: TIGR03086 family metal-binding protein [Frankia sp.]
MIAAGRVGAAVGAAHPQRQEGPTIVTSPERHYEDVLAGFGARVRAVAPEAWDGPTPNIGWSVRELVNHVTAEQLWAVPLLAGETIDEVGDRFAGDVLGADPVVVWERAAAQARQAFSEPDALERTVCLSSGPALAAEYCFQMTTDLLVHGWDLAVAIGETVRPDPIVVHETLMALRPQAAGWRASGAFGAPVELAFGASEWATLLALTGRDPAWRPPAAA